MYFPGDVRPNLIPDKTFSALLETKSIEREKEGGGEEERMTARGRVVGLAFNRRRDAPFLRPRRGWARASAFASSVSESTLTDLANYRAGSSAYLP